MSGILKSKFGLLMLSVCVFTSFPFDFDGGIWNQARCHKNISCSTQLSMKLFLLINVKMPTTVGILTFKRRKNSIIGLSKPEKRLNFLIFLYI